MHRIQPPILRHMLSALIAIAMFNLVGCQQPLFKHKTGLGGLFDKGHDLSQLISESTSNLPPTTSYEERLNNLGIASTSTIVNDTQISSTSKSLNQLRMPTQPRENKQGRCYTLKTLLNFSTRTDSLATQLGMGFCLPHA